MPKNLKAESCDAVLESALENMDWCAMAQANNCSVEAENSSNSLSGETARLQEPLSSIIANQEIIYNYLQESIADLNQSISGLQNTSNVASVEEPVVDEKELQRQQLQAQIEALQNEMSNL
jgi:hypothetical protein